MALEKTTAISEEIKEKFLPCLVPDLISSEESGEEDEGQFIVRPLPWRSEKVDNFFATLDHKHEKRQTVRSKKMSYGRKDGLPSDRPKPRDGTLPKWLFKCSSPNC